MVDKDKIIEEEYKKFLEAASRRLKAEAAKSDAQRERETLQVQMEEIGAEYQSLFPNVTRNKARMEAIAQEMKAGATRIQELTAEEAKHDG